MNYNILLFSFVVCFYLSCNSQRYETDRLNNFPAKKDSAVIDIDSIYLNLSGGKSIKHKQVAGQFVYQKSNPDKGEYLADFVQKSIEQSIKYISYGDERKDIIMLGKKKINLRKKFNPLSINIYQLPFGNGECLAFVGKPQSASGSGAQITYFVLVKFDNKNRVIGWYEFESRFGTINIFFDCNGDQNIDYFKIVHAKKRDEYYLTVHDVQNGEQICNGYAVLRYQLYDKFRVVENTLSK